MFGSFCLEKLHRKEKMMQQTAIQALSPFMDVEETSKFLRSTPSTVYTYLSRKRFPKELYTKIGKKPLFIRENLLAWIMNGGQLVRKGGN